MTTVCKGTCQRVSVAGIFGICCVHFGSVTDRRFFLSSVYISINIESIKQHAGCLFVRAVLEGIYMSSHSERHGQQRDSREI